MHKRYVLSSGLILDSLSQKALLLGHPEEGMVGKGKIHIEKYIPLA